MHATRIALIAGAIVMVFTGTARPQQASSRIVLSENDWVVPIHTTPDTAAGARELWAAGPSYKASFHDGFRFYAPGIGSHGEAESWSWRTAGVRIGGRDVVAARDLAAPQHAGDDHRYEYRYPGLVEAYDVRSDGIEQSFVLYRRPSGGGALEITGEVTTGLRPDVRSAATGGIEFRDREGRARIRYGAATAMDAAGRRTAMGSRCAGGRIVLSLDAAWLDRAAYPVVVDPLVSTVAVEGAASLAVQSLEISTQLKSGFLPDTLVTFARRFSVGDWDAYGYLCDNDFSERFLVFSDVTTAWSSPAVTSAHTPQRFVIAVQRDRRAGIRRYSEIACHTHSFSSTELNSGLTDVLVPTSPDTYRRPSVGGTGVFSFGSRVLVAFDTDRTLSNVETLGTRVGVVTFDASSGAFGTPFFLTPLRDFEMERPSVNVERSGGLDSWIVVYQTRKVYPLLFHWTIHGVLVDDQLRVSPFEDLTPSSKYGVWQGTRPRVAGDDGRYLVAFHRTDEEEVLADELGAVRFDWPDTAQQPVLGQYTTVLRPVGGAQTRLGGLAFDAATRSHWVVSHRGSVAGPAGFGATRLGYSGGLVETTSMLVNAEEGGAAFSNVDQRGPKDDVFLVLSAAADPGRTVSVTILAHDPEATNVVLLGSCGSVSSSAEGSLPYAGSELLKVTLELGQPAPFGQPAALLLGAQPADLPLDPLGLVGCRLRLVPAITVGTSASSAQSSGVSIPLPDRPPFLGDLWFQWVLVDPASTGTAGVGLSHGLRCQVRV